MHFSITAVMVEVRVEARREYSLVEGHRLNNVTFYF